MATQLIQVQHISMGARINDAIRAALALKLMPTRSALLFFKQDVEAELAQILEGGERSRLAGSETEAAEAGARAAALVSYFKIAKSRISAIEQKINNERLLRQDGVILASVMGSLLEEMSTNVLYVDLVSSLLEMSGQELLAHYLEHPAELGAVVCPDGYTLADMFAKYAQPDVVKSLLTAATNYERIWQVLARAHTVGAERECMVTNTLALAKASMEGRDDGFLSSFASEAAKVLIRHVKCGHVDSDLVLVAADFGLKDEVELAMLAEPLRLVHRRGALSDVLEAATALGSTSKIVKQRAMNVVVELLHAYNYCSARNIANVFALPDQEVKQNAVEMLSLLVENGDSQNFRDVIRQFELESSDLGASLTQAAITQIVELVDSGDFSSVATHFRTLQLFPDCFAPDIILRVMDKVRASVIVDDLTLATGLSATFHFKRDDFTDVMPDLINKVKTHVNMGDIVCGQQCSLRFPIWKEASWKP